MSAFLWTAPGPEAEWTILASSQIRRIFPNGDGSTIQLLGPDDDPELITDWRPPHELLALLGGGTGSPIRSYGGWSPAWATDALESAAEAVDPTTRLRLLLSSGRTLCKILLADLDRAELDPIREWEVAFFNWSAAVEAELGPEYRGSEGGDT